MLGPELWTSENLNLQEEDANAFLFDFLVYIRDVRGLFFFSRNSIVWGLMFVFINARCQGGQ